MAFASASHFRDVCRGFHRVLGLCGVIGSGKSNAREVLSSLGAFCVDADKLGHAAYEKGTLAYDQVVATFFTEVLDAGGSIDRKKLGAQVFGQPEKLAKLNAIVWPEVERLAIRKLNSMLEDAATSQSSDAPRVGVIEAALLIEAGWAPKMDELWITYVPDEVALARIQERDGVTEEAALKRLRAQLPSTERLKFATVVIDTSGEKGVTRKIIEAEWQKLQERIASG
jgi:dephospho-CoA kinase